MTRERPDSQQLQRELQHLDRVPTSQAIWCLQADCLQPLSGLRNDLTGFSCRQVIEPEVQQAVLMDCSLHLRESKHPGQAPVPEVPLAALLDCLQRPSERNQSGRAPAPEALLGG